MKTLDTVNCLRQLVKLPSWVGEEVNELPLLYFLESLFQELGYSVERQTVGQERFNLLAFRIDDPAIVFLGHADTVPLSTGDSVQGMGELRDGKIWGRGAVDMKAGLAIMASLAATTQRDDVAFLITIGEEYDFAGIQAFTAQARWNPKIVFNPEPTDGEVALGCRGVTEFKFTVQGRSAHAGRKELGINAIEAVVQVAQQLEKRLRLLDTWPLRSSVNVAWLEGGLGEPKDIWSGSIGQKGNVVPDFCRAGLEIRTGNSEIEWDNIIDILEELCLDKRLALTNIVCQFSYSGYSTPQEGLSELFDVVRQGLGALKLVDPNQTGYFEVQQLARIWDCPCVVFGPGPAQLAHQPEEYVELDSLIAVEQVYQRVLEILPQKQ